MASNGRANSAGTVAALTSPDRPRVLAKVAEAVRVQAAPVVLLAIIVAAVTTLAAGDHALPLISSSRATILAMFSAYFLVVLSLCAVFLSLARAPRHIDPHTRQLRIRELWGTMGLEPISAVLGLAALVYGTTACGNLVELYRLADAPFHDGLLWRLEEPVLPFLAQAAQPLVEFWDAIYFAFWPFIFLTGAVLHLAGRGRDYSIFLSGLLWSFLITRLLALSFPTAGPVFYQPDAFNLAGTSSAALQQILERYMAGELPQDGTFPGTMAMPSLHIGVTALAAYLLARVRKWTLFITLPWFILTWIATVVLGWHYIVDGLGGILVSGVAYLVARGQQHLWERTLITGHAGQYRGDADPGRTLPRA